MPARVVAAFLIAAGGCSSAKLSCLYTTERATGKDLMLIKEDEKVMLRTCSIPQNHNRVRLVVGGWYASEDARLKLQVRTDTAHSWVDVCRRSGGSKDADPGKPCGDPYFLPGPVSQLTMRVVGDDYSGFCVNCNMYFSISLVVESEPVDAPPPPPSCVATAAMGRWVGVGYTDGFETGGAASDQRAFVGVEKRRTDGEWAKSVKAVLRQSFTFVGDHQQTTVRDRRLTQPLLDAASDALDRVQYGYAYIPESFKDGGFVWQWSVGVVDTCQTVPVQIFTPLLALTRSELARPCCLPDYNDGRRQTPDSPGACLSGTPCVCSLQVCGNVSALPPAPPAPPVPLRARSPPPPSSRVPGWDAPDDDELAAVHAEEAFEDTVYAGGLVGVGLLVCCCLSATALLWWSHDRLRECCGSRKRLRTLSTPPSDGAQLDDL